jgi:proteasome assembly chaperone (PAC2) family protein
MAYRGWNDAGAAASHAAEYIVDRLGGERFGFLDHEEYYDFTQARPHTRPAGEYQRELTWPQNEFFYARGAAGGRDVVLFVGTEPHLKWRRYGQNVVRLTQDLGVTEALALGALLADTPHTRPVPLSGGSSTPELGDRLKAMGIHGSRYEGPTGILSVVGSMLTEVGIPNGSIWAAVPHYISATPNPRAAAVMVRQLNGFFRLDVPVEDLESEAATYEAQVESAISGNPEAQQYVRELELQSASESYGPDLDSPPADVMSEPLDESQAEGLIQSVEEFLRRQQEGRGREGRDGE